MLPGEAHELLLGHSQNIKHQVPFDPNKGNERMRMWYTLRVDWIAIFGLINLFRFFTLFSCDPPP